MEDETSRSGSDQMPCLFGPDEAQYDRYAACLAATEGLRRLREKAAVKKSRFFKKGEETEDEKRANAEFVLHSGNIVESLGMSVAQFNQIGRKVMEDSKLKEKVSHLPRCGPTFLLVFFGNLSQHWQVMEQAFLYRMAAAVDMDRVPIIEDPASEQLLKATRRERVQMFCQSIQEIETLRAEQMAKLTRSLHVDKLPEGVNLSDPAVLPFLNPKVRAVVEAFPFQAEEIVKKHGLHSDEFNKMLQDAKSNPVFRWRVDKYMAEEEGE